MKVRQVIEEIGKLVRERNPSGYLPPAKEEYLERLQREFLPWRRKRKKLQEKYANASEEEYLIALEEFLETETGIESRVFTDEDIPDWYQD